MRIELDTDKKRVLLMALKNGYIDSEALDGWATPKGLTDEQLETELDSLAKSMHPKGCERLKRLGLCELCKI